jgi:acetyltransferase
VFDLQETPASDSELRSGERAEGIIIRPIRPDDEPALGVFFSSLLPVSRHRRFLAVMNELPAPVLARFARPEAPDEVALVATARDGGKESMVGEARFVFDAHACRCAELAVAVTDAEQGRGLGERLRRGLIRRARDAGVACVYGDVLPDNHAMLGLARKLGFSERRSPADPRLLRVERAITVV